MRSDWRCSRMRPAVKHMSSGNSAMRPSTGRAPTLAMSQPLVYALLSTPIAWNRHRALQRGHWTVLLAYCIADFPILCISLSQNVPLRPSPQHGAH